MKLNKSVDLVNSEWVNEQTNRWTDRLADEQTGRQTDGQTDSITLIYHTLGGGSRCIKFVWNRCKIPMYLSASFTQKPIQWQF